MASIPQYMSDNYIFPYECGDQFATPEAGGQYSCGCGGSSALMWSELENNLPFLDMVPPETTDQIITTTSSSLSPIISSSISFPETFGVPDHVTVPALMPAELFNVGLCDADNTNNIISASQSLISTSCIINNHEEVCDFKETTCNDLRAIYAPAANNWGKPVAAIEEQPTVKVGRYSVEERKDKILRYLKKRNQRNFNKTIKYACRKTLADKRVRVRGRFARKNEPSEEDNILVTRKNNNDYNPEEEREFYNNCAVQIKYDDEDWLQDCMGSLMYFPYIAG